MKTLSLDIGTRRTGIAYLDDAVGVPLPLDTLHHASEEELITHVQALIRERKIDRLLVGLPLLPSGEEGSQALLVRSVASRLTQAGISIIFVDERYSSPRSRQLMSEKAQKKSPASQDPDAMAACALFDCHFGS